MKILIADDHPLVRGGLSSVLVQLDSDVQVLEAVDHAQTLAVIEDNPDLTLVLLDLGMPDVQGMIGLEKVQEEAPTVPVVVLSGSEDPDDMRGALDRGAAGFIPKSSSTDVMLSAIKLVLSGGVYVPPVALGGGHAKPKAAPTPQSHPRMPEQLTGRQGEVFRLMRQGFSNKEIARDLGIAESTVKAHVSEILRVLGVNSRAKAVLYGQEG